MNYGHLREDIPMSGPCDVREAAWEKQEACEICQNLELA